MDEANPVVVRRSAGSWRVGRKVGRTVYADIGDGRGEQLIGIMDTIELAGLVVAAVNALAPDLHSARKT